MLDFVIWAEHEKKPKLIGKNFVHALKFFNYVTGGDFKIDEIITPLMHGRVGRITSTKDPAEQTVLQQLLHLLK